MASQKKVLSNDGTRVVNNSQRLFLVYLICILVDMTILNVFAEFTHSIYVESFSITIFIAIFLQLLIVFHAHVARARVCGGVLLIWRSCYSTQIRYRLQRYRKW